MSVTKFTRNGFMRPFTAVFTALLIAGTVAIAQDAAVTYLQKREALAEGDWRGRVGLGHWCEANALPLQAASLYRETLKLKPDHQDAYDRLVKIADTHVLPENTRRHAELLKEFKGMSLHTTRHFIILYDTTEPWPHRLAPCLPRYRSRYSDNPARRGALS